MKNMRKVLTIAGSDCSGGAGIQADLKTMTAHGVYGMSVITALTAQNTCGVDGIFNVDSEFTGLQMKSVFEDIVPDAVKVGMVSDVGNINVISEKLAEYNAKNIVVDTVMVSTSGHSLIDEDAKKVLIEKLIPMATVITPNLSEARELSGMCINSKEDMEKAAVIISEMTNAAILIKGGHSEDNSDDLLYIDGKNMWFKAKRIDNENTHGTGCTLSSAIACNLANGLSIEESVSNAKKYITGAIDSRLDIGRGRGPLNHMFLLQKQK